MRFGNDLSPESLYKAIHPEIPRCGIEGPFNFHSRTTTNRVSSRNKQFRRPARDGQGSGLRVHSALPVFVTCDVRGAAGGCVRKFGILSSGKSKELYAKVRNG